MDKEFKKIFDKLHGFEELKSDTEKVFTAMQKYQEYLDLCVELGIMSEREARMQYFNETMTVIGQVNEKPEEEEDDDDDSDDAEEEQDDGEDEDEEDDEDLFPLTKAEKEAMRRFKERKREKRDHDVAIHVIHRGHVCRCKNRG